MGRRGDAPLPGAVVGYSVHKEKHIDTDGEVEEPAKDGGSACFPALQVTRQG